jgi:hypothetical protein
MGAARDAAEADVTKPAGAMTAASGQRAMALWAALFLALIFLPGLQQAFKFIPVAPLSEKRDKAPRPPLALAAASSGAFMEAFDRFYNDRAGLRETFIRLNNDLHRRVFAVSPNAKVILGKEGWLYWGGTMEDFAKEYSPLTAARAKRFCRSAAALDRQLKARGVDFIIIIAPNKNTLYPEYMPDRCPRLAGPSLSDRIVEDLRASGVETLFLKEALQQHQSEALLYEPRGTHWNPLGAAYAAAEILRTLGGRYGIDYPTPARLGRRQAPDRANQDLLEMVEGFGGCKAASLEPEVFPYEAEEKLPPALWYGDSFSNVLLPYLQPHFASLDWQHIIYNPMSATLPANLPGKRLVVLCVAERNVRHWLLRNPLPDLEEPPPPASAGP